MPAHGHPGPHLGPLVWVSGICSHLQTTAWSCQGLRGCRMGLRCHKGPAAQTGRDRLSGTLDGTGPVFIHRDQRRDANQPQELLTPMCLDQGSFISWLIIIVIAGIYQCFLGARHCATCFTFIFFLCSCNIPSSPVPIS